MEMTILFGVGMFTVIVLLLVALILFARSLLVSTGDAFVLASPRLSARSGGNAEFLAGGQVPVVTSNINGTSVTYARPLPRPI